MTRTTCTGTSVRPRCSPRKPQRFRPSRTEGGARRCDRADLRRSAGAGTQEIYQITSALKQLPHCKHVAVLTDARFSGVSTGACIGHISPEALAGGAIGKIREGDQIEIIIDRKHLSGSVDLVGDAHERFGAEEGSRRLAQRRPRPDLHPHPSLPDDTRLWAALVQASGGVWGGCVYDPDKIIALLQRPQDA